MASLNSPCLKVASERFFLLTLRQHVTILAKNSFEPHFLCFLTKNYFIRPEVIRLLFHQYHFVFECVLVQFSWISGYLQKWKAVKNHNFCYSCSRKKLSSFKLYLFAANLDILEAFGSQITRVHNLSNRFAQCHKKCGLGSY